MLLAFTSYGIYIALLECASVSAPLLYRRRDSATEQLVLTVSSCSGISRPSACFCCVLKWWDGLPFCFAVGSRWLTNNFALCPKVVGFWKGRWEKAWGVEKKKWFLRLQWICYIETLARRRQFSACLKIFADISSFGSLQFHIDSDEFSRVKNQYVSVRHAANNSSFFAFLIL